MSAVRLPDIAPKRRSCGTIRHDAIGDLRALVVCLPAADGTDECFD